jgi:hypothetical protein
MTETGPNRSREACPACGAHELHLLRFPAIDVTGARQYDDMLGFGDVHPSDKPGIGCAACGAAWDDLEAFHAHVRGTAS